MTSLAPPAARHVVAQAVLASVVALAPRSAAQDREPISHERHSREDASPAAARAGSPSSPPATLRPEVREVIEAADGDEPPRGYHEDRRSRLGMVRAGMIILGSSYLTWVPIAVLVQNALGYESESEPGHPVWQRGTYAVYVPLVGPFLAVGNRNFEASFQVGAAALGVSQIAGLGILIAGFPERDVFVRDAPTTSWRVAPIVEPRTLGLRLLGRM